MPAVFSGTGIGEKQGYIIINCQVSVLCVGVLVVRYVQLSYDGIHV